MVAPLDRNLVPIPKPGCTLRTDRAVRGLGQAPSLTPPGLELSQSLP